MATPKFPLPNGFRWQYELIIWIQSFHNPWLDKIAILLSYLGTESCYMLVLPILFLAINRRYGLRLAYVFMTSMFFNAWLKAGLHIARPMGVPGIRSVYTSSATGLSMPSGHAQGTITFFVALSRWLKKPWVLWLGTLLVVGISLSRIYLGLHWPVDVLIGWLLGLVFGVAGWNVGRWWSYRSVPFHFALVFAVLFPAILFYMNHDPTGAEYATFLFASGSGALFEMRFVKSSFDKGWWKRVCAAVIGIGGVLGLQYVLKAHATELPWRLLRDLLIGWWITFAAPWLFVKLDLYRREEPDSFVH
ncbi:phosphatase PAP2 family protein [Alicyclobacillus fodiniaquatilis]|uniref:Phosphatase PAP2 family protein n=1 Tax=Alicyclobacillus fodiniaquatilis TaxID=1661150 RepID=A0ABW4JD67_9BACL